MDCWEFVIQEIDIWEINLGGIDSRCFKKNLTFGKLTLGKLDSGN